MRALVLSKTKFENLKKYVLDKNIANTECKLYLLDLKLKKKLLKIFYINEGLYFGNKLLTINSLIDQKDNIGIDELVMPNELVVVQNKVAGFSMPYIENNNLQLVLQDYNVSITEKIKLLKQVGKILETVVNTFPYNKPFYLSDIHEGNFIVDNNNNIKVVDMDGCKIANNDPSPIKYLQTNPNLNNSHKYIVDEGIYKPNINSEYMCYMIMILNTISHTQINKLTLETFYEYICYLRKLGFSYELLEHFSNIYTEANNENPLKLLDEITYNKKTPRAHYKVFEAIRKKSI